MQRSNSSEGKHNDAQVDAVTFADRHAKQCSVLAPLTCDKCVLVRCATSRTIPVAISCRIRRGTCYRAERIKNPQLCDVV